MYVKEIEIGRYRHLKNVSFGPFRAPEAQSSLVVLAGTNGSGKSSVLELVSKALSDSWSLTYQLNRAAPESSFEVTFGVSPQEVELVSASTEGQALNADQQAAIDYLKAHGSYRRSFGFEAGEYAKSPAIHNYLHSRVTNAVRAAHDRSLGFFLGADRSYHNRKLEQKKFFQYEALTKPNHWRSFSFQPPRAQYEDMFDFLVMWRFYFARDLGAWYQDHADGADAAIGQPPPEDEYGRLLSLVYPGYRFTDGDIGAPTDLFVRLVTGETVPFSDLSSGEKEVFFILCFFQRHGVEDAVILIDEPELHLHPDLTRRLVRTMQRVKPHNQIWLATQSAAVIEEAPDDAVFFLSRGESSAIEVVRATEEDEARACLREFFGYSGYIGLAQAMVFTEGRSASADRRAFSRLMPGGGTDVRFVPSASSTSLERINRAVLSLVEANLARCHFFLIRDRDYLTLEAVQGMQSRGDGKLFVLGRHELENYLLEPRSISEVLSTFYGHSLSPEQVLGELRAVAESLMLQTLRDMVAFRLNLIHRPEDFTVPKVLEGERAWSAGWVKSKHEELGSHLRSRYNDVLAQAKAVSFDEVFANCSDELAESLRGEGWLSAMPGKEVIKSFCIRLKLGEPNVFRNAVIDVLSRRPNLVAEDLRAILKHISERSSAASNVIPKPNTGSQDAATGEGP